MVPPTPVRDAFCFRGVPLVDIHLHTYFVTCLCKSDMVLSFIESRVSFKPIKASKTIVVNQPKLPLDTTTTMKSRRKSTEAKQRQRIRRSVPLKGLFPKQAIVPKTSHE